MQIFASNFFYELELACIQKGASFRALGRKIKIRKIKIENYIGQNFGKYIPNFKNSGPVGVYLGSYLTPVKASDDWYQFCDRRQQRQRTPTRPVKLLE